MTEIKEMSIEEVESRTSALASEIEGADESRMAEIKTELDALEERKAEIKKIAAEAKETREMVADDKVAVEQIKEVVTE